MLLYYRDGDWCGMLQREFNSLDEVLSIVKCSENEVEKLKDDFKAMSKGRIYKLFFLDSYEKE